MILAIAIIIVAASWVGALSQISGSAAEKIGAALATAAMALIALAIVFGVVGFVLAAAEQWQNWL